MSAKLANHSYGKSDIRLTKVIRDGDRHSLLEFSVDVLLDGDFGRSYTAGDNAKIVATDSMKNTVYVTAKEQQFDSPERFAVLLSKHFCRTYEQVSSASVTIRQTNWARIDVDEKPHDHAFVCGGPDLRTAVAKTTGNTTTLSGGISDLLVLKTTRSVFKGFVTDRYRTLKDADDRIFATKVTAAWDFETAGDGPHNAVADSVRTAMLETFATHMSYAVQETMFEMGKAALAAVPSIGRISLSMPNKHRIPVNLQPFGLTNDNEIFVWTEEPYGKIDAVVTRE